MRVDNNMAMLKTQDMAADRARDVRVQSLNPAAMEQEETKVREEELSRPQAVAEAEYARIEENKRQPGQQQDEEARQEAEAPPEPPDEETLQLQREAAERLLNLPVDVGKFAGREQRRIDLLL
ncbi:MAG: hypothetical protein FWG93_06675 [Oscillospiraceae bacterium]|nr:hypothetical protein [Oscillospiraceae bacterium]